MGPPIIKKDAADPGGGGGGGGGTRTFLEQPLVGVPIFKHIIIRLKYAHTLGHLKLINFPFGTNGKFIIFRRPNTSAYYGITK